MSIKIITVGNKPDRELSNLIDDYIKRIQNVSVEWRYLKHGSGDAKHSKQQESEIILKNISEKDFVLLLDEAGQQLDNLKLSDKLFTQGKDVTIVIGGAYGVSSDIKKRADFIWSLSRLVFPHQIVRLILAEQIYRSYSILIKHPYHHS